MFYEGAVVDDGSVNCCVRCPQVSLESRILQRCNELFFKHELLDGNEVKCFIKRCS